MARLLILVSLFLAPVSLAEPWEAVTPDAALAADDECAADDEACALNAVQLRASQQGGVAASKWYLGKVGASCTETCKAQRLSCSAADLSSVKGWQPLFAAAQQAGATCKFSWANDGKHGQGFYNVPAVCTLAKCGVDMQGTCAYDTSPKSTCEGVPATGFSRLCPCSASAASSFWPSPSPTPSSASGVSPAPAPASGGVTPSGACKADTGGTCKIMGCAKSRGKGVACDKKTSKCKCKPGYCASNKGVCVKSTR